MRTAEERFTWWLRVACYAGGIWISGLVYFVERKDPALRAHAQRALWFHLRVLGLFMPVALLGAAALLHGPRPVAYGLIGSASVVAVVGLLLWIRALISVCRSTSIPTQPPRHTA